MKYVFTLLTMFFLSSVFAQNITVSAFQDAVITATVGGQANGTFAFPNDVSSYNQVNMTIDLDCPPGIGCDPWDRIAHVKIIEGTEEFEIGRFATPYGNGDCGWVVDVTDYIDMLTGNVDMKIEIETFQNGWEVSLDFEFIAGARDFAYTEVINLWNGFDVTTNRNYFNYQVGDTLWNNYDLPARNVYLPSHTGLVEFKVFNTGHGQGNTLNAAEFKEWNHTVVANSQSYNHYMWNTDCNQNPCSPQGGTWTLSRAGWCPGEDAPASEFDVTSDVTLGQTNLFDYILEPYLNRCSPLYPACNPAADCAFGASIGCGYDGQNHTEPRFKMSIQLVLKSNSPFTGSKVIADKTYFEISPNPSNGNFTIDVRFEKEQSSAMEIYDVRGAVVHKETFDVSSKLLKEMNLNHLGTGLYFIKVQTENGITTRKVVIQ